MTSIKYSSGQQTKHKALNKQYIFKSFKYISLFNPRCLLAIKYILRDNEITFFFGVFKISMLTHITTKSLFLRFCYTPEKQQTWMNRPGLWAKRKQIFLLRRQSARGDEDRGNEKLEIKTGCGIKRQSEIVIFFFTGRVEADLDYINKKKGRGMTRGRLPPHDY